MKSKSQGFTLAEMLIALALIGIIAAMLIPKILQSSSQKTDIAKARNLMSLVERAYYETAQDPEGPNQTVDLRTFIQGRINGQAATSDGVGCAAGSPGFRFSDGTAVYFEGTTAVNAAGATTICFDLKANAASGASALGSDVFTGTFDYVDPNTPVKFNWGNAATNTTVSFLVNQ
jgi:prepilin-type N-terminal cleavage/methylation domain-containing protein